MKQEEVPQDKDNLTEGKVAKLYYATNKDGHYLKVNSVGWEPETVALKQAWDVVNNEVEDARQQVVERTASPILYFMKKNIMDVSLVAGHAGISGLLVRLHLKPWFFKRLSNKTLEKYAFAFRISVNELLDIEKIKNGNSNTI